MAFYVYSDDPAGKSSRKVSRFSRLRQVARQLEADGHTNVCVGQTDASAIPIAQWEIFAGGVTVKSV